ncbi:uncharacterized protein (DUF2164 family) [Virgibacillus natechei]|uniref:Uncharacterized protein (DUF2164 family) n=1 Tax=Virgibacillus natechei TaxID=1216297 RepID=A0ABS4IJI9_9BACI|nr:DUF2164 domain-containing protein [Virgibacillus natechei]MBP1970745.1 uncharacterized protein (DUF2164 family) [Virgibacillus natechei]UZD12016.1 DUF2164 domain-containing protein [Virgibacillus natechei]
MKPKFELTKDQKNEMVGLIQGYFEKERNEQIGNLAAMLMLDFFMEELAPVFYNKGVEDSHAHMTEKLDDIFEIQK